MSSRGRNPDLEELIDFLREELAQEHDEREKLAAQNRMLRAYIDELKHRITILKKEISDSSLSTSRV